MVNCIIKFHFKCNIKFMLDFSYFIIKTKIAYGFINNKSNLLIKSQILNIKNDLTKFCMFFAYYIHLKLFTKNMYYPN